MNKNPFQDPSVLQASSTGITPPALDPSKLTLPAAPPASIHPQLPPLTSPSPVPINYQQHMGGVKSVATSKNQHNFMEEISESIKATNSSTILRVMRTVNLLLASATIVAGLLAWIFGHVTSFQKIIAGIYIIMFGSLLLVFELRTEKLDQVLRLNFGFMYGNKTRTTFLLFIAIWPLSMGNFWLTILDAVLLFLNAFFNYYVVSQHPAFSDNSGLYQPAPQYQA